MIQFKIPYSNHYQVFASVKIFDAISIFSDKIEYDLLKELTLLSVSIECNSCNSLAVCSNLTAAIKKHFNGFVPKSILVNFIKSTKNIISIEFSKFSDLAEVVSGD